MHKSAMSYSFGNDFLLTLIDVLSTFFSVTYFDPINPI